MCLDSKDIGSHALRWKDNILKKCFYFCVSSDQTGGQIAVSALEPFTSYTCTGHIKSNNETIVNTADVNFKFNCGTLVFTLPSNNTFLSKHNLKVKDCSSVTDFLCVWTAIKLTNVRNTSTSNQSISLTWNSSSENCQDLISQFSYNCMCGK